MKAPQNGRLTAAVRFLRKFSDIAAIDEPVDREECFRLVLSAVDPLANGDELQAGEDDLSDWASARGRAFFQRPDDPVLPALARVSAWATGQTYEAAAIATFLQVADYWLAQGINRLVFHTSAHQPLDTKPGNTMVGTHLNRNITWAE